MVMKPLAFPVLFILYRLHHERQKRTNSDLHAREFIADEGSSHQRQESHSMTGSMIPLNPNIILIIG